MINVTIVRSSSGEITSFTLSGHAFFAEHGNDIVCAGVSAVSFGAVNAIIALTGVEPVIEQDQRGGFLRCDFPVLNDQKKAEQVQLLLEAMLVSLETIERDYGKHVKIVIK
jgi:uncharacterized protein YsxB (DUF464 family)